MIRLHLCRLTALLRPRLASTPECPPLTAVEWRRDVKWLTALLLGVAIVLVALRDRPLFYSPPFQVTFWLAWLGAAVRWVRWASPLPALDTPTGVPEASVRARWLRGAVYVVAVFALSVVAFQLPLRLHFWGGYDEVYNFQTVHRTLWCPQMDGWISRPLSGLSAWLGHLLSPIRVDGYLWLAGGLCVLNGLLLAAIVRRTFPGDPLVAVAAGVLLICHRGDPSRFFVMWTSQFYWTTLALLLLGAWLSLTSARSGSRIGLVAGCAALAASLLTNESGFPLALFGPILLWAAGVRGRRLLVWSYAWFGTTAVLAARFAWFLVGRSGSSYQSEKATRALSDPTQLVTNLGVQSEAFFSWFGGFHVPTGYWLIALAASVAVIAAVASCAGSGGGERPRRYLAGLAIALAASVAGLVPFLPIPGLFRTQFLAAPGEAVVIALALGLVCARLGRRLGPVVMCAAVALLAANSAVENRRFQERADKTINFVKTVRILRQVHTISPNMSPDTLVVFVSEGEGPGPFGSNDALLRLSENLLGYCMIQTNPQPVPEPEVAFHPDRVVIIRTMDGKRVEWERYLYERVVVFHVSDDGTLALLREVPEHLLPESAVTGRYDPLPQLRPGLHRELPVIRYPLWHRPVQDVTAADQGLVFGTGWSSLKAERDEVFRWCDPGAELVVNPQGLNARTIHLDLAADMPGACRVEARDSAGRVLTQARLTGRQEMELTFPTNPERVQVVSLHAHPEAGGAAVRLRAFAPGRRGLPPPPERPLDIAGEGLRVGAGWHPRETWGGDTFRWFDTGAELQVSGVPGGVLVLVMEAGPGAGGSARLRVVGPGGAVLHDAPLGGRQEVRVPVPPDLPRGARFRLEVTGGGLPVANDPRILNARVFRATWTTADPDITGPGLDVGGGWQLFETWEGESFRWFDTGAELLAVGAPRKTLVLEMASGPGAGGSARLRVVGPGGAVLYDAPLAGRQEVRVPMPPDLPRAARFRLEVTGGGAKTPGDPRVLNARVFRAAWAD